MQLADVATDLLIEQILARVHQEGEGGTQVVGQLRGRGLTDIRVEAALTTQQES